MKSLHVIQLFCLVLLIATASTDVKKRDQIVDANHFFSEQNKQKGYTITQLEKGKPVVVVLRPLEKSTYSNTITLSIKSGTKDKSCKFRSYEDLCVLDNAQNDKGQLYIKCQNLPCEASWSIFQPQAQELKSSDTVENLYKIPANPNGLIVSLFCPEAGKEDQKEDPFVLAFSNIPFQSSAISPTAQIIAFKEIKQNQGYIYMKVNPKFQTCTKLKVYIGSGNLSKDPVESFLVKDRKSQYVLENVPDNKNFVIQIAYHSLDGVGLTGETFISITGTKNGQKKILRNNKISFNPSYKNFDLSYGVPKIDIKEWKDIKLELQTQSPFIIVQLRYKKTERFEVQATQFSYFDLKVGQKLEYKLIQQKNAQQTDTVNIFSSQKDSLKISKASCNVKTGCQFQIQAIKDIKGNIYIGSGTGQQKEIIILDFGTSLTFTHKIKQLESVYIKKKLQLEKAIQVTINSPNVIVYLSNTKKCAFPTQDCYEKVGSINRHFIYYPNTPERTDVIFLVRALDTCQFTITLINQDTEFVNLVDSQPFVYQFDKEQKQLKFKFKRESKADITFNLIGPLQALDLIAENGKNIPQDQQAKISLQGFLEFKAEDSPKDQFIILVRKRQNFYNKFVHFTLIASTKGKYIRLQSGITHYQTLTKSSTNNASYVFSFDPTLDFFVNFYCHNTKEENIDIKMELKAFQNKETDSKIVSRLTIDKPSDALDLSQVSKQLCKNVDNQDYCEISMILQNNMNIQVDIAITLLSEHTILQLKDGVWQSFSLNSVAKSTHFYFFPRNKDHDIGLMFKTTDPSIRLKYRMFYGSDSQVNTAVWPFPSQKISEAQIEQQKKHRPINHFGISKSAMKQCWPNCVVLVSVIDLQKKQIQGSFSIMASNFIMQIPQKQKVDITLKQGENKAYLVDLKYALDMEKDTFIYIYDSIGLTSIFANVYSQKNDRIPDSQQYDFDLNSKYENLIQMKTIQQIIKRQQMDEHINIYLYIVVQALTDSKVAIQFSFNQIDQPSQKLIGLDTFEHVVLNANQQRIFYTPIQQPYEIKVIRDRGFPLYSSMVCKKDIDECLKEMRGDDIKGTQILQKVAAYTANPCQKCTYLFKLKTQKDPIEVTVHLQSRTSQIQLTQNKAVYDFTEKAEFNNYVFYAIRGEQIYVNIHITQGEIQAEITDQGEINQKKSSKNIISFVVPAKATQLMKTEKLTKQQKQQLTKEQAKLNALNKFKTQKQAPYTQALMSAFGLSDKFIQMHVSIRSLNRGKPSLYTISYSSGERQFDLQDGLITNYMLEPSKQAVFYYTAREAFHIYLTISMQKSSYLKDLQISFKYCQPKNNIIDEDCWIQYKTDNPTVKDKVPHPTLVYLLANKNNIAIFLTYNGGHSEQVSLGINHQEIMLLPFDIEYPFILHSNQTIDFLVEISNNGYIEIVTRKCDQSNPTFAYTFDYDAFQNNQFTYEAELGANPKSKFVSKVKSGILYLQMRTELGQQPSVLSVSVHFSQKKITNSEILAGNKGNLEYSILDSSNGVLYFNPPTCPDSSCPKFKYYIMSAPKMRDLYTQLVCPSNLFTNVEYTAGQPVKLVEATPKQNSDGTLQLNFQLVDQISYVGIKATNGKDKQIFYKPVEVATFWGQLSRTSHSHKLTIVSLFICAMVGVVIFVRRSARRGYKPINDQV